MFIEFTNNGFPYEIEVNFGTHSNERLIERMIGKRVAVDIICRGIESVMEDTDTKYVSCLVDHLSKCSVWVASKEFKNGVIYVKVITCLDRDTEIWVKPDTHKYELN